MHAIRLRGPWEFAIGGTPVAGRIEFPCNWRELLSAMTSAGPCSPQLAATASLRLRRHFHLPTGLEAGEHVWLVVRSIDPMISAQLNGEILRFASQADGSQRADVTNQLAARNELTIDVAPPSPALLDSRDAILEVTLQIEPSP